MERTAKARETRIARRARSRARAFERRADKNKPCTRDERHEGALDAPRNDGRSESTMAMARALPRPDISRPVFGADRRAVTCTHMTRRDTIDEIILAGPAARVDTRERVETSD